MATRTSVKSGNWNDYTVWGGSDSSYIPGSGDAAVIAAGHTVAITANTTVGNNASAVGHAITVNGILTVNSGVTLLLKGYDNTSNRAMQISTTGTFQPSSGSTVQVLPISSWQTTIDNQGNLIADGVTFESAESWTFTEVGQTLSSFVYSLQEITSTYQINMIPIGTTAQWGWTPGPISNAAGTAVGTGLDNSFSIVSVTGSSNSPTSPYNVFTRKVSSYDSLVQTGDYFVDCKNGVVFYYDSEMATRLTITYTCKSHKWLGWGINSSRNGASKCLLDNCTFRRMGGQWTSHNTEASHCAVYLGYRVNAAVDSTKEGRVTGCTFEYCLNPLYVYNSVNTQTNPFQVTGNTFVGTPKSDGNWKGNIIVGYFNYINISNNIWNNVSIPIHCFRSPYLGLTFRYNTGFVQFNSGLPDSCIGSYCEYNELKDTGTWNDAGGFQTQGVSGNPNYYRFNKLRNGNRCGRVGPYMIIEDNEFSQYNHHGFVAPASNGYFSDISIKRNVNRNCRTTGDMSGGWTLGYNYHQWLDNITIENNTFDTGVRSICFNDREGSWVLGTRIKIRNNICTNNYNGANYPGDSTASDGGITRMQIEQFDYNNFYGQTAAGNINQSTFKMSSQTYMASSGNCTGVALYNPQSIDLNSRSLSLVVGNGSITLAWGGGSTQELVVVPSCTISTSGSGTMPVIADSGKSWTSKAYVGYYARFKTGTAAGQIYMIWDNAATSLSLISNLASPANIAIGDTFEIIKSQVNLTSSDGHIVTAGIHLPTLPTALATYTDNGITNEYHGFSVDPQYVNQTSGDLRPQNTTFQNAGFDGTNIGALALKLAVILGIIGKDSTTSIDAKIGKGTSSITNKGLWSSIRKKGALKTIVALARDSILSARKKNANSQVLFTSKDSILTSHTIQLLNEKLGGFTVLGKVGTLIIGHKGVSNNINISARDGVKILGTVILGNEIYSVVDITAYLE